MRPGAATARLLTTLIACLVPACVSSDPSRYAAAEPRLELEQFFAGPATAVGTVTDRAGRVIRRFRARASGSWSEAEQALTVAETWYWDDGEVEPRLWRWEKQADGRWRGLEDDLNGAAEGRAVGNTVRWTYSMNVDTNAYGRLAIHADDVMHLVDPDNIINLVDMSYLGFHVGRVVLHIQRGDGRRIEPWPTRRAAPPGPARSQRAD